MPQQRQPLFEPKPDESQLTGQSDVPSTVSISIPKPRMPLPTMPKVLAEPKKEKQWNTSNLGLRLGADVTSAASAAALIAPIITVIDRYVVRFWQAKEFFAGSISISEHPLRNLYSFRDTWYFVYFDGESPTLTRNETHRSIVEKAANGNSFSSCLKRSLYPAVTRPHRFLFSRPFLLIFTLYFSTYATANSVDTLRSTMANKPAATVSSGATKFLATSSVNMSLCVYKDSCFARMFGASASTSASAVPKLSLALFAVRDSLTIFASFNLPSMIAPQLANLPAGITSRFSRLLSSESGRLNTAQFLAPAAIQLVSTPIHLLGLDLYNRQGRMGFRERYSRVVRDWGVSALARMGRIVVSWHRRCSILLLRGCNKGQILTLSKTACFRRRRRRQREYAEALHDQDRRLSALEARWPISCTTTTFTAFTTNIRTASWFPRYSTHRHTGLSTTGHFLHFLLGYTK